jgi:hypothetical protein
MLTWVPSVLGFRLVEPEKCLYIVTGYEEDWGRTCNLLNLKTAVAGLKTAYLSKITLAFEFSVLTLTVPGLGLQKVQNPASF